MVGRSREYFCRYCGYRGLMVVIDVIGIFGFDVWHVCVGNRPTRKCVGERLRGVWEVLGGVGFAIFEFRFECFFVCCEIRNS